MRFIRDARGYTLMEFSIAAAILLMIMVSVAGVVYAAQKSTHALGDWGDRSEQLRLAMNLIGQDATYGQWYAAPLYPANAGWEATLRGYQLKLNTSGWDATWAGQGWPGWISQSQTLFIDYTIDAVDGTTANLTRHVYDSTGTIVNGNIYYKAYSTQILIYDILPYDTTAAQWSDLAHISYGTRGNLEFSLYAERQGAGGGKQYAPALVQFNLREPAR